MHTEEATQLRQILVEKTCLVSVMQQELDVLRNERDTTLVAAAGSEEERRAAMALRESLETVRVVAVGCHKPGGLFRVTVSWSLVAKLLWCLRLCIVTVY